jgi:hypothetical protein
VPIIALWDRQPLIVPRPVPDKRTDLRFIDALSERQRRDDASGNHRRPLELFQ